MVRSAWPEERDHSHTVPASVAFSARAKYVSAKAIYQRAQESSDTDDRRRGLTEAQRFLDSACEDIKHVRNIHAATRERDRATTYGELDDPLEELEMYVRSLRIMCRKALAE